MGARDLGALVLLGALWGASYMFIRVAVPALGPFALMGLRVALAASVLGLYAALLARGMPKLRSRWKEILFVGATNSAIPFSLIAAAEIKLTASLAAILNSTTALFAAVIAALWIGEELTMKKVFGLVMGLVGVAVLVGWGPCSPLLSPTLLGESTSSVPLRVSRRWRWPSGSKRERPFSCFLWLPSASRKKRRRCLLLFPRWL